MQAKDIMTVNVVSVSKETPIHEVVGLLLKHRISAVPVVDSTGAVVGIVSEGDLLRGEGTSRNRMDHPWWLVAVFSGGAVTYEKVRCGTADGVMTRNVVSVDEDTPLPEIAELLERRHIKRVPVVANGKLVGIVSRANLLHGLANMIVDHHEPGAEKDRHLRNELLNALLDRPELESVLINVVVRDGKARLWGVVESDGEVAAAAKVAEGVPGVVSVENNLNLGPLSGVPV